MINRKYKNNFINLFNLVIFKLFNKINYEYVLNNNFIFKNQLVRYFYNNIYNYRYDFLKKLINNKIIEIKKFIHYFIKSSNKLCNSF